MGKGERMIIQQMGMPHLIMCSQLKGKPIDKTYVTIPDTFNKKVYIHYGSTKFSKKYFHKIKNVKRGYNLKPKAHTGLWASPLDAKEKWYNYCAEIFANDSENLNTLTRCFLFTLKSNANVIHICKHKDLLQLPVNPKGTDYNLKHWYPIDFEKCLEQSIDAIELHLSESKEWDSNHNHKEIWWDLYGWDCDSILIMNPDIIDNLFIKESYLVNMKFIDNSIAHMYEIKEVKNNELSIISHNSVNDHYAQI